MFVFFLINLYCFWIKGNRVYLYLMNKIVKTFKILFVCLGLIVPLENFSLIWRRRHYLWWSANCHLFSALIAIEQWGFFSTPHLLWHRACVYNGHLRGPVTLTPIVERAVELSLPVFTTRVCRGWVSYTQMHFLTHCYNPNRWSLNGGGGAPLIL